MSSKRSRRKVTRRTSFEPLEARQVFSADPLGGAGAVAIEQHAVSEPDFWYDTNLERELDALLGEVEQSLAAANEMTGLTQARNDYGFLGYGQTVAVIDSGIAWDHPNLGGGLGSGYRVVGGWDFTYENDADPYDDGPSGAHGTHVSGIIGATANSSGDEGVAPGVDLVGLRVFNDQGAGYFNWVENALRWVHTNRNNFANPITAVNLSLGTAWNAATIPSWAMLEDEFAQLKADGIFVSVSAGNSFTSYNTPGLSYPAASASVVPVMSVDDNGSLSYFSQRHDRAIAAPGRTIRSTVPDYVGNQNGQTDDWASFSGTSMAAPYIAGASVLVREAMQFVGYVDINQDTIYDHMRATADNVWDAATNAFYKRLNLGAAIDALMPEDDYGSTAGTAFDLGTIGSDGAAVSGTVGKSDDVDFFRFTAAASGTVTFTAATTHYLDAAWTGGGTTSADGLSYTIDVVAGQSYTVGLSTTAGVGHFQIDVTAESTFSFVDWGTVAQQQQRLQVGVNGEAWYGVTAQQAGYLTAEAFITPSCQIELAWFDSNMQQVATGAADPNCVRADRLVGAGEQLYLRVTGSGDAADFRLTNLVTIDGDTMLVSGTAGDDVMSFTAGTSIHALSVNGVSYSFASDSVSTITFQGGDGQDTITMTGTAGNETATLRVGAGQFIGSTFTTTTTNIEHTAVAGGGGADTVTLYDSSGNDVFGGWTNKAVMFGSGYSYIVSDFSGVIAHATKGTDQARYYDGSGDDTFGGWSNRATMFGAGYSHTSFGFTSVVAYSTQGGKDQARFYDSSGNDIFGGWSDRATMFGSNYSNTAYGFASSVAYSTSGGSDQARFYDSASSDVFGAWPDRAVIYGTGFSHVAHGFRNVSAYSTQGGSDQARFFDSAGTDFYTAWWNKATMYGTNYSNTAYGFANTVAHSQGGSDSAQLYDSEHDDTFTAWRGRAFMTDAGYSNDTRGFRNVVAHATLGGTDRATLYDSSGNDSVVATNLGTILSGLDFRNEIRGAAEVTAALVNGGDDAVNTDVSDYAFYLLGQVF